MQAAQNELITRIGPGTACGALMRRYWQPVALLDEFDPRFDPRMAERPLKAVRLLGQDLVLWRDTTGRLACWTATARTAAPTWPLRAMKATVCAAPSTAGSSTPTAAAWTRRPNPRAARCASGCASAATRCRWWPACCSPGWAPKAARRPCCRRWTAFRAPASHSFAFKGLWRCNWLQAFEVGMDPAHASFLHRFLQDER
jgi:phthalate 4,5-dioxygenase oxygenase subunit